MSVYKKGNSWYFRFTHGGKCYKKSCGRCSKEQAEQQEAQYRSKLIDVGISGYESGHTLYEAVFRYLEEYTPSLKMPEKYYDHVAQMEEFIKDRPLEDIFIVSHEMITAMQGKGLQPTTINRRTSILRRTANLAHSHWKWLAESPHKKFQMLSEKNNKRTTALTIEEVEKLARCAPSEFTRDIILFAAYTGLRGAEIYRIGNDKSFLKGDVLQVDGKCGIRTIPINQDCQRFVKRWCPQVGGEQGGIAKSIHVMKKEFRLARFKAELDDVRFHDLRHTYGTWLADNGRSTNAIMRMMGLDSAEMANRYINQSMPALRELVIERNTEAQKDRLTSIG